MQNSPTQIGITDEYTVNVQLAISVADGTFYYLRGAFYQPGTSNYCGYTLNGTDWFKGPFSNNGDQKQFYKIQITNHQWSGQLKAKIDADDSGCAASGTYSFKIERVTDSSNTGTFDTQTEQTVNVVIPTPTPTVTPIPTPTNTPVPPTATPTPKVINNPTTILVPTLTEQVSTFDAILGTMSAKHIHITPTAVPTELIADDSEKKSISLFPLFFIHAGFCLLASCGILIFLQAE